jgi:hypothetical protein
MAYIKDEIDGRVNYHNGELPFHHPARMGSDATQCIRDVDMWLTVGYSLALHVQHILLVLEEHGLTHILEKDYSVRHLFNDEVSNGRNAAKIKEERELIY